MFDNIHTPSLRVPTDGKILTFSNPKRDYDLFTSYEIFERPLGLHYNHYATSTGKYFKYKTVLIHKLKIIVLL